MSELDPAILLLVLFGVPLVAAALEAYRFGLKNLPQAKELDYIRERAELLGYELRERES